MTEKLWGTVIIGLIGALLVFARRFKNEDGDAGYGVAGWTIILIIFCLVFGCRQARLSTEPEFVVNTKISFTSEVNGSASLSMQVGDTLDIIVALHGLTNVIEGGVEILRRRYHGKQ